VIKTIEEAMPIESGYGSNGASEITLSSANEDASSSRSCSASAEETPDQPLPSQLNALTLEEVEPQVPPAVVNGAVKRRSKASVDKIAALKAHRASCPTGLKDMTALAQDQLNLNSSFSSVHSSSSNVSIERATDDEVI